VDLGQFAPSGHETCDRAPATGTSAPLEPIQLRLIEALASLLDGREGFGHGGVACLVLLAPPMGLSQQGEPVGLRQRRPRGPIGRQALAHLGYPLSDPSLGGQPPSLQDRP
jgi:hypothetical protein